MKQRPWVEHFFQMVTFYLQRLESIQATFTRILNPALQQLHHGGT